MFVMYNPNPTGRKVGDCAVRAIAKALNIDWEEAYARIITNGFLMGDMPSSNSLWGAVLRQNGFSRKSLPDNCPDCYTAGDFFYEHPNGTYVLGFGNHVPTVVAVDTLTHTLKNLKKIIEAEGGEEYSTRRYSYGGIDHMNTNNYMDRHSYDYRGMYSRADDISSMIREIRQLGEYLPASKQVDVERLINRLERV